MSRSRSIPNPAHAVCHAITFSRDCRRSSASQARTANTRTPSSAGALRAPVAPRLHSRPPVADSAFCARTRARRPRRAPSTSLSPSSSPGHRLPLGTVPTFREPFHDDHYHHCDPCNLQPPMPEHPKYSPEYHYSQSHHGRFSPSHSGSVCHSHTTHSS